MRKALKGKPGTGCPSLVAAATAFVLGMWCPQHARAELAVSCGGFAMLGGAQINCSHVAPKQPTQFCTFSWALLTMANAPQVVQGAFVVPPGAVNQTVYTGAGFSSALGNPIVLCQGKKSR